MYLSKEELKKLNQVDIKEAVLEDLVDIQNVEIDMKKSVSARAESFVQTVNNPFLVRVGEYVVKIGYTDCQETLNDRMKQYIRKIAEIKY